MRAWKAAKRSLRYPMELRAKLRDRALERIAHHYLAICAIFRNEAPFFREWIEFHLGVGASHFFLYNNFSEDDYQSALSPWIKRGVVTLYEWPKRVGQMSAYFHCARRHAMQARWIAFIDLDEFLFSPQTVDILPVLRRYHDQPAIVAGSFFFGSSGHLTRPDAPLVESFTLRSGEQRSGKTIANPRHIRRITNAHTFTYYAGTSIDTSGERVRAGHPIATDVLRINHYWSRAISDMENKVKRGDASSPLPRALAAHLEYERSMNEISDTSIVPIFRSIIPSIAP